VAEVAVDEEYQMTGHHTLVETERAVAERLGGLPLDFRAMAVVSNLHRAAGAIRNHVEQTVLRRSDLTWTGFVVLWVIWIWGEPETRHAAEEAGISKGTLTGVVKTLETRGFVERSTHPTDGRLVLLRLTEDGTALMEKLFPAFNEEERFVLGGLSDKKAVDLAAGLRHILTHLEGSSAARLAEFRTT
jgi:DNA-binding MarR family transcriptional regulator